MPLVFKPNSFPKEKISSKDNEYLVYEALKKLPQEADGLTVIYNPDFNSGSAEADFLLLHPDFGCLILEVKNWNSERLEKNEGRITTNGNYVNPREQLRFYRERLLDYIKQRNLAPKNIKVPISIALLLINPSCNAIGNPTEFFEVPTIKEEVIRYNGEFWKAIKSCAEHHKIIRDEEKKILEAIADSFYRTETPEILETIMTVEYKPTDDILDSAAFVTLPPSEKYQETKKRLTDVVDELGKMLPKDSVFQSQCASLAKRVKSDELRVGLFGLTGAGKSTFVNALLGVECMRMGYGETTRVITELRCPDEKHSSGAVELIYKTLDELNREVINDVANDIKIDDNFTIANESIRESLKNWVEEVEDPDDSAFVDSVLKGWDDYHERLGTIENDFVNSEIDNMLHSPKGERLAVFIKMRKLYFEAPFLIKDLVLLDTPGFGSGVKRHTELCLEMAKSLDVILLLDKVKASVMGEEIECIHRLFESNKTEQLNSGGAQFICILNQLTTIPPGETAEEQISRFQQRLREAGIKDAQIYGIDAAQAFWAKLKKALGKLSPTDEEKYRKYCPGHSLEQDYEQSRFSDIEDKLPQYFMNNKYKVGISPKVAEFFGLAEAMEDYFAQKLLAISSTNREAKERLNQLETQIKRCKEEIRIFKTENLPIILRDTEDKFIEQHNMAEYLWTLYQRKINELGRLPIGNAKRKALVDEIRAGLDSKLQDLREELMRTYITMRDTVLKQRIEDIISKEWPGFKVGVLGEPLKVKLIDDKKLMQSIIPGFLNMLIHIFSPQENFEEHFNANVKPYLEMNIHANIGSWAGNFVLDAEKQFGILAKSQKEALEQASKDVNLSKEEKNTARNQLTSCKAKLAELKLKLKPVVKLLESFNDNSCNIATLDLSLQNGNLSRRLIVDNRIIELPSLENVHDTLAGYEDQWKLLSCNAKESFIKEYTSGLEELLSWKDIDKELEKTGLVPNILQLNLFFS